MKKRGEENQKGKREREKKKGGMSKTRRRDISKKD